MAQQQQQSQGGGDSSMSPVWIMALLFFFLYLFWNGAHDRIVSIIFTLNILQAKLVMLFYHSTTLANDILVMKTTNPKLVTFGQLITFSSHVGDYTRYPIVLFILVLAWFLYKSDVTSRFRKTYDMQRLSEQEKVNWPAITPVVDRDLSAEDINTGPWAMALTPMEFARKYKLLKKNDAILDKSEPGQELTAGIRRSDAKRIFTLQLGPVWGGFEKCPPYARALAAVFISRMNRDKDTAAAILSDMDKHAAKNNFNMHRINEVLVKYQNDQKVQVIFTQHAYFLTVMAALLASSRDDGVVPSSEFLWLKPIDRRLWYMLNSVGRQTPYSEVGGPFAHWNAEKKMGRRLLAPLIDEASKALAIAVKEIKLSPQELQELLP